MAEHCSVMKQYHDVQDSWDSAQSIIEYWSRGSMLWPEPKFRRKYNTTHTTGTMLGGNTSRAL